MDFLTDSWRDAEVTAGEGVIDDGHGGGDPAIMKEWLDAIASRDQSGIITGPDETLETHITTFAAERSRLNGTVEIIDY